MKLALVHHQLAFGGGMESYFLEFMQEALQQGHEVTLWVMERDLSVPVPPSVSVKVMPVSRMCPRFLRKYWFAWKLKRHRPAVDLVVSTTRSFGADILITGGTHRGYMRACHRSGLKDHLEAYLEAKAYRSAAKIIAHSEALRQELIELYRIDPKRIQMLYPPVDVRAFPFQKKAARSGPLRLLFASTSHQRKGGFLLLEALKKLPRTDFELTIVGKPFKAAAAMSNVRCFGYVQNIADFYHEADWLVLPSYFEPFGLVVVQALECGTPVLVSARVGAAALLDEKEGLILKEQTATALAQLLQEAKRLKYVIQPGFVARHDLSVSAHVEAVLRRPAC